jgi:hypothetical protein
MLCDLTREVERLHTSRVGHNDIYPASIRNVLQGNHQIYGHIRSGLCTYAVKLGSGP